MSSPGAPSAGPSTPPSYSSGPSTPPCYSSGLSTPPNYSSQSSRNAECSNCKHLRGKISVLKATMNMHMHLEQHTVNSAVLLHEKRILSPATCRRGKPKKTLTQKSTEIVATLEQFLSFSEDSPATNVAEETIVTCSLISCSVSVECCCYPYISVVIVGVDSSYPALELANQNIALNNMDPGRISFLKQDATAFMKSTASRNEAWDIVILDPPKLAPRRKVLQSESGMYRNLNSLAMRLTKPDGFLMSCSCSGAMTQSGQFLPVLQASLLLLSISHIVGFLSKCTVFGFSLPGVLICRGVPLQWLVGR
nr:S-adenosyl-L-methionine-dependent methyltransferases superfamily protein [Tanacetum cinerariifolium]